MKALLAIWLPLAARLIRRHRRKSLAAGGFIAVGSALLVLMHAMTMGIADTMVLNTTTLHTGHVFTEFSVKNAKPESIARLVEARTESEAVLYRYRFTGLARSSSSARPLVVFAVEPGQERDRTAIGQRITEGSYINKGSEILMGSALAEALDVHPGRKVTLIASTGRKLGTYTVSGIFETRVPRLDEAAAYVPISSISRDMLSGAEGEVSVFLRTGTDVSRTVDKLNREFPKTISFTPWTGLMPDLVQLIQLNRVSTAILMALVFALVGFGIANIFVLTTMERFRELGILKAMGMTPGEVVFLIFLESFLVCTVATCTGLATGWGISEVLGATGIDLGALTSHNRYFVVSGVIHPRVSAPGLIWPAVIAFAVSLVSSWLPARAVARRLTAEALRYS